MDPQNQSDVNIKNREKLGFGLPTHWHIGHENDSVVDGAEFK